MKDWEATVPPMAEGGYCWAIRKSGEMGGFCLGAGSCEVAENGCLVLGNAGRSGVGFIDLARWQKDWVRVQGRGCSHNDKVTFDRTE